MNRSRVVGAVSLLLLFLFLAACGGGSSTPQDTSSVRSCCDVAQTQREVGSDGLIAQQQNAKPLERFATLSLCFRRFSTISIRCSKKTLGRPCVAHDNNGIRHNCIVPRVTARKL